MAGLDVLYAMIKNQQLVQLCVNVKQVIRVEKYFWGALPFFSKLNSSHLLCSLILQFCFKKTILTDADNVKLSQLSSAFYNSIK